MKQIMAVYDVDPFYADRFAEFVNQREQIPFTVMAFTSMERLRKFAAEHTIQILLISGLIGREEISQIPAKQVMTLSDGEVVPLREDYKCVYKYQSTDSIIREVMASYCEQPVEEAVALGMGRAGIIGVYSPIGRCLKTSFSLAAGQVLSKDRRTLYVNLEEYSGMSALTGTEYKGNLSDILYYYRQGSYNWMRFSSCVYTWGGLDYIAPVRYPEDLLQIGPEDTARLLERIAGESGYEVMVIDIGQAGKHSISILDICQVIFMPVKEDCISVAKLEEFDQYLEISGKSCLQDKIKRLKLPYHISFGKKESYMEQLVWGELGDYVRHLLKGQGEVWRY